MMLKNLFFFCDDICLLISSDLLNLKFFRGKALEGTVYQYHCFWKFEDKNNIRL